MSVSYGGDSITFADGSVTSSGWTGYKNRLINGDMRIDQRNAGANVAIASAYTVDRWKFDRVATGGSQVYYGQQVTDAPTGFTNSYQTKVTTGGTVGNDDYTQFNQYIEGYNVADMAFGTASAKTFTVSFWVKSSVATTYSVCLRSGGFDRSYVATYTVNATNTWEYKTITVPGCTDGTWYTNNSYGIDLHFSFGCGSTYGTSTLNTWITGSKIGYTHPGMLATTGATAQITGVQLEKGSTASSFEYRPYGTELQLCERYYQILSSIAVMLPWGSGTQIIRISNSFKTTMRANPSITMGTKTGGTGTMGAASVTTSGVMYYGSGNTGDVIEYQQPTAAIEL